LAPNGSTAIRIVRRQPQRINEVSESGQCKVVGKDKPDAERLDTPVQNRFFSTLGFVTDWLSKRGQVSSSTGVPMLSGPGIPEVRRPRFVGT
jgi:hypothetical protein